MGFGKGVLMDIKHAITLSSPLTTQPNNARMDGAIRLSVIAGQAAFHKE